MVCDLATWLFPVRECSFVYPPEQMFCVSSKHYPLYISECVFWSVQGMPTNVEVLWAVGCVTGWFMGVGGLMTPLE